MLGAILQWICRARKREATQYNTAKLSQPRPNLATPMHQDMAREKAVNRREGLWFLLLLFFVCFYHRWFISLMTGNWIKGLAGFTRYNNPTVRRQRKGQTRRQQRKKKLLFCVLHVLRCYKARLAEQTNSRKRFRRTVWTSQSRVEKLSWTLRPLSWKQIGVGLELLIIRLLCWWCVLPTLSLQHHPSSKTLGCFDTYNREGLFQVSEMDPSMSRLPAFMQLLLMLHAFPFG